MAFFAPDIYGRGDECQEEEHNTSLTAMGA